MKPTRLPVVYVLHGMKRSGNHALVNWLLPQLRCTFINNAIPIGPILRGGMFPERVPFEAWRSRFAPVSGEMDTLLVSLEDHALEVLPFLADGIELRRLLIVRRPDQLFSSRIRKAFRVAMPAYPSRNDVVMQRAASIWKQHARCFLDEETQAYPGRIAVSFDDWVSSREYRASISAALGVPFDDGGFGRVSDVGGGSSFDGGAFDGRGHEMNLANRVSQLEAHERTVLDEVLADIELKRLSDALRMAEPLRLLQAAVSPASCAR